MPKRILYLENGIGYGGSAICLKLIVSHLDRSKYYPIVVTSRNEKDHRDFKNIAEWLYVPDKFIEREVIKKKVEDLFFKIKILPGRSSEITSSAVDYLINFFPYLFRLLRLVKKNQVDMIHLNNEALCNMGGVIAANLLKIPSISHVRGPAWDSRTSRFVYRNVDYFITVSEWIKKEVLKLHVPERKIKTIWDGRNLEEFNIQIDEAKIREEFGLQPKQPSVGMIGRLNPWKGHKVFIKASEKVLKQFPDCKIFIVGGAAQKHKQYEAEVKSIVYEKKLSENIIFAGQRKDVAQIMGILDVIVHASIEPDPYPNVVIEAMLVGKPVIASNTGGPVEMIENYKTGILIPPKDPAILGEKICQLLENRKMRMALGSEAKKVAFERYSIENHVRKIEAIYEEVMNKFG